MFREASSFFAIALVLLVGACVYIESQGGNPFGNPPVQNTSCKSQDYRCIARDDAIDNYLDADWFEKQINQESGFNPNAVSPMGAIGIAQFMPATAAGLGIDPHDPVASLSAAASAMARYNNQYGNYAKALAAYNCGTSCVNTAIARCGVSWRACVPAETDRYIRAIMGN
jgi:soluble lytic murein transglycosylase-like protein